MKVIYLGSFDPLTLGHLDIIKRASGISDEVIIAVLKNTNKKSFFSLSERVSMIEDEIGEYKNVKVLTAAASSNEKFSMTLSISASVKSLKAGISVIFGSAARALSQLNSTLTRAFIKPYSEKIGRNASTDLA